MPSRYPPAAPLLCEIRRFVKWATALRPTFVASREAILTSLDLIRRRCIDEHHVFLFDRHQHQHVRPFLSNLSGTIGGHMTVLQDHRVVRTIPRPSAN